MSAFISTVHIQEIGSNGGSGSLFADDPVTQAATSLAGFGLQLRKSEAGHFVGHAFSRIFRFAGRVRDGVRGLGSRVRDGVCGLGSRVRDGVRGLGSRVRDGVRGLGSLVQDGVHGLGGRVRDGVRDLGSLVQDGVHGLRARVLNWGSDCAGMDRGADANLDTGDLDTEAPELPSVRSPCS